MDRNRRLRSMTVGAAAAAVVACLAPSPHAQGGPQLRVTAIANQGALKVGLNTFRVNVQNSSQSIPATGPVKVKLEVLDPNQVKTEYTVSINGVPPGQDTYQPAWFRTVNLQKAGAYTISAIVDPDKQFGIYPNESNRRTETFTVPGGGQAATYRLLVTVKNANGSVANGLRVSLKTAEGQELFWKMTSGVGQADFQKVAPSPEGKPYTVLVTVGALTKATQQVTMPAADEILNVQLP